MEKKECLLEKNKLAIWVDFSAFSSREAFFKGLVRYSFENLKRAGKTIDHELLEKASAVLAFQKAWDDMKYDMEIYFETLRAKGYYTIFVLDEFDEARTKFRDNAEAFREMRHLGYDSRQYGIAFVTTSRRSIRDIEIQSKVSSTLDGIFGKEYLTMYDDTDLCQYYGLYEDVGLHLTDIQKHRIEYYCGGHPYLLASLGFQVVERFKEVGEINIDAVFRRTQLQFSDYYELLISLLREDRTFANLL